MTNNQIGSSDQNSVLLRKLESVPDCDVDHGTRKNITIEGIQDLAIAIYRSGKRGTKVEDIRRRFSVPKLTARRSLKYFHGKHILFTAKDLKVQGIDLIPNTNPQQYFPTCLKPEILKDLKKTNSVPVKPTGVDLSTNSILSHSSSLSKAIEKYQTEKARSFLDALILVPFVPPYLHRLQFLLNLDKEYYNELQQKEDSANRAKFYGEIIGKRYAKYTYSPNGTVEIAIRSNKNPFRIASDEDVSIIFSTLGQVRDRMLFHVSDLHERAVPSIMEWTLEACDLNKDILIDDKAQLTLPDIQLKYADKVFRAYVKIIEDKAYLRTEESLKLNQILPEALDNIRHPYKSVESKLDQLLEKINQLNLMTKIGSPNNSEVHNSFIRLNGIERCI